MPIHAARARTEQDVLGFRLPAGGYVILDVDGTDHDPAHWRDPYRFDPGRFLGPASRSGHPRPTGRRRPAAWAPLSGRGRHPRSAGGGGAAAGTNPSRPPAAGPHCRPRPDPHPAA
ncbi:cytochrome P450 [Jiangella muralis]|uniref:cytochrome P450 n=1 Tax=Jiangella muralis TaxID=702383 RepID=UPI003B848ED1